MSRILLVDDDIAEISSVKRVLLRGGHQPVLATNASDATAAVGGERPDLVIVSATCENGEALALARRMRQEPQTADIPIVVLGDADPLPDGARRVSRPIDPEQLLGEVNATLGPSGGIALEEPPAPAPRPAPAAPAPRTRPAPAPLGPARPATAQPGGAIAPPPPSQLIAAQAGPRPARRPAPAAAPAGATALAEPLPVPAPQRPVDARRAAADALRARAEELRRTKPATTPAPAPGSAPAPVAAAPRAAGLEAPLLLDPPDGVPADFPEEPARPAPSLAEALDLDEGELEEAIRRAKELGARREDGPALAEADDEDARHQAADDALRALEEEASSHVAERARARQAERELAPELPELPELPEPPAPPPARPADDERALQEAIETARREAFEAAKREAFEAARREAFEAAKRELDAARQDTLEAAKREALEAAREEALEAARRELQEQAQREAAEAARLVQAEARARQEAMQRAQREAQALSQQRAHAEQRARTAEEQLQEMRAQLEEERRKAEERVATVMQRAAQEEEAADELRRMAEEELRRRDEESTRSHEAEEEKLREAIASARAEMEELRRRSEDEARRRAEAEAALQRLEEERRQQAEEQAAREAAARAEREAEAQATLDAEEQAVRDAEEQAAREAEEQAAREAEAQAARDAEARTARAAAAQALAREAAARAARDDAAQARAQALALDPPGDVHGSPAWEAGRRGTAARGSARAAPAARPEPFSPPSFFAPFDGAEGEDAAAPFAAAEPPPPDPTEGAARRRVAALRSGGNDESALGPPTDVLAPRAEAPAPPPPPEEPARVIPPPPAPLRAGELGDLPLPRLLAMAARAKLEGRIDLAGEVSRSIWFEDGRVVGVASADPSERVEEIALRLGLITRDQHRQVAQAISALPSRRAALLLLERGFLKPTELTALVRRRTEEVVFGAFGEEAGRFRWAPAEVPPEERTALERGALALAVEGVRRRWRAPRVDALLGGPATLLAPVPGAPAPADLGLGAEERRVVALADGLRALDEIVQASPLDPLSTRQVLAALVVTGALGVRVLHAGRPRGQAAQAIDLARVKDKLDQVRRADYFTVLGVGRLCTPHEVREAAERLLAEFDPRRFAGVPDEGLPARLSEIVQVLQDAREVLADDRLRDEYLRGLGDVG